MFLNTKEVMLHGLTDEILRGKIYVSLKMLVTLMVIFLTSMTEKGTVTFTQAKLLALKIAD